MEVLNCTFSVKTINLQKIEIKEGDHKLSTTALTHVECVCNFPVDSSVKSSVKSQPKVNVFVVLNFCS